jgi:hypothetical protein
MGTTQPVTEIELEQRRSAFRRTIASVQPALQELARSVGMANATQATDDLERLLDAVDAFLAKLDTNALDQAQDAWIQTRCAFLVGEVLRTRHGGTWFVQEDAGERFYLMPVVGAFHHDASMTVSPPGIVRRVFAAGANRSLRQEIANLGLDNNDTAPQVDLGNLTGRHRGLVPKIRCLCGRSMWDLAGGHGGKAWWMPQAHVEPLQRKLRESIGAWLAACEDGRRNAFLQSVLGMDADGDPVADPTVIAALVARAASDARRAFECAGCGRIWMETDKDTFVPYSPDTGRRQVLAAPDCPSESDTVRPPDRTT